jgi:hypothetical protein
LPGSTCNHAQPDEWRAWMPTSRPLPSRVLQPQSKSRLRGRVSRLWPDDSSSGRQQLGRLRASPIRKMSLPCFNLCCQKNSLGCIATRLIGNNRRVGRISGTCIAKPYREPLRHVNCVSGARLSADNRIDDERRLRPEFSGQVNGPTAVSQLASRPAA